MQHQGDTATRPPEIGLRRGGSLLSLEHCPGHVDALDVTDLLRKQPAQAGEENSRRAASWVIGRTSGVAGADSTSCTRTKCGPILLNAALVHNHRLCGV